MKLLKTSNGKTTIKMSKNEWKAIGKKSGWMKIAGTPEQLEYKFGLVYKVSPPTPNQMPEGFTPVSVSHVTLIGGKILKPYKTQMSELFTKIQNGEITELSSIPDPQFGEQIVAKRPDGKSSLVAEVTNQIDFQNYVNLIWKNLGIDNPEQRFFHLTIANNQGGDPFKSIGDINLNDFNTGE